MRKIEQKNKKKLIMRKICWKINDFMKWFRQHFFCYHNIDREAIREEIKSTNLKADNYEKVEEYIPQIQETINQLHLCNSENEQLNKSIKTLNYYIQELYIAELKNDSNRKKEIFDFLISIKFISK